MHHISLRVTLLPRLFILFSVDIYPLKSFRHPGSFAGMLHEKFCLVISLHLIDPGIRKMLVKGMHGYKSSTFHSGPLFTFN